MNEHLKGLSDIDHNILNANELEFIAQETLIDIYPSFEQIELITLIDHGSYGPFKMNQLCTVPLFVALDLKRSRQCDIVPPAWFTVEALQAAAKLESEQAPFVSLPFHYFEIAHLLLKYASDNLINVSKLRQCLKDVEDARQVKLSRGLSQLEASSDWVRLDGIGSMELMSVRTSICKVLEKYDSINQVEQQIMSLAESSQ